MNKIILNILISDIVILDIIVHIASFDEDIWYKLYTLIPRFKEYATSYTGRKHFIKIFTKISSDNPIIHTLFKMRHREDDLPAVIYEDGTQMWYKNGNLHRDGDLPTLITNGSQHFYKHGRCHRDGDLPAIIYADGYQSWYKDGKYIKSMPL